MFELKSANIRYMGTVSPLRDAVIDKVMDKYRYGRNVGDRDIVKANTD